MLLVNPDDVNHGVLALTNYKQYCELVVAILQRLIVCLTFKSLPLVASRTVCLAVAG